MDCAVYQILVVIRWEAVKNIRGKWPPVDEGVEKNYFVYFIFAYFKKKLISACYGYTCIAKCILVSTSWDGMFENFFPSKRGLLHWQKLKPCRPLWLIETETCDFLSVAMVWNSREGKEWSQWVSGPYLCLYSNKSHVPPSPTTRHPTSKLSI